MLLDACSRVGNWEPGWNFCACHESSDRAVLVVTNCLSAQGAINRFLEQVRNQNMEQLHGFMHSADHVGLSFVSDIPRSTRVG